MWIIVEYGGGWCVSICMTNCLCVYKCGCMRWFFSWDFIPIHSITVKHIFIDILLTACSVHCFWQTFYNLFLTAIWQHILTFTLTYGQQCDTIEYTLKPWRAMCIVIKIWYWMILVVWWWGQRSFCSGALVRAQTWRLSASNAAYAVAYCHIYARIHK